MTENPQYPSAQDSRYDRPPQNEPGQSEPASSEPGQNQPTGDIVIDAALQDLQNASPDDLDAQIEAGQRVHQTLQARLSDLGGE